MAYQFDLDTGFGSLARIGLIVLSTDETIEAEARLVLGNRPVNLLHARIPTHPDVTPSTLKLMEKSMPDTAALLPADLDALGYACTSGATVIGPDRVAGLIGRGNVSDPITAVAAALTALGARRICYVSPYVAQVTAPMRAFLKGHEIETVAEASFAEKDDFTVARITEKSTKNMILEAVRDVECDAVFASCTNLRTFGILEDIEAETGLPMVSSNQALIWHLLHLTGVDATGWGPGKLFRLRGDST